MKLHRDYKLIKWVFVLIFVENWYILEIKYIFLDFILIFFEFINWIYKYHIFILIQNIITIMNKNKCAI
jgi:hypothetical protein